MAALEATESGSFSSPSITKRVFQCRPQHRPWSWPRTFKTYRNQLNSALWPGSLTNMAVIVGGVVALRMSDFEVLRPIEEQLVLLEEFIPLSSGTARMVCGSTLCGLVIFSCLTSCRRLLLRRLLARRAWMYENPGKESVVTVMWAVLVKLLSGWSPSMYSYQSCMPILPVPPLNDTLEKLIASLEPLYRDSPKKLMEFKDETKEFKETVGYKLQRALVLRSFWVDNYVSDWWENYVYLMNRSSLAINSNYYIMDQCYWIPTPHQTARAAGTLYQLLLVREQLLGESFQPVRIRNLIPTCMAQYRRIFSTTRIPGEEMDKLVHYSPTQSKHVVVSRRGMMYSMEITDTRGHLLAPSWLQQQMEWIVADADSSYSEVPESHRLIPALTSQDRKTWAKVRQEFFSLGVNRESLECLESAVLFLIAMSDGHIGMNCEHSYADAPCVAHIFEHSLTFEATKRLYDSYGNCVDPCLTEAGFKPTPLMWEVDEGLQAAISRACSHAQKNIEDLDLTVHDHTVFGKGAIKKCRHSPDAFIQMALHTTYRKLTGGPALTYEASMTRLYKHGRTETVRSLTTEANLFVNAFLNPNVPTEEKKSLLKTACEKHVLLYKDAMNGKGIDRHLFALYVASRGMGLDCKFLKKVLSLPWTLSTSQQPQQQISWAPNCGKPKYQNLLSPGGGFGPVAEDGYGVSYMVPGDLRIFFHVSSRRSGQKTSSKQFVETLESTMADMIRLCGESAS
ncbi:hypothetical protein BsWGS_26793 [Bradybaena similaris]